MANSYNFVILVAIEIHPPRNTCDEYCILMASQPLAFFLEKGKYRGGMKKVLTIDVRYNNFPSAIFLIQIYARFYGKIYSRACVELSIKLFFFFLFSFQFCSNARIEEIYVISQYSTVARKEKIYIFPCIVILIN